MRGTIAKRIRSKAQELSKGQPYVKYASDRVQARKMHPACTRAITKTLKKAYKRAQRQGKREPWLLAAATAKPGEVTLG